jgi:hypothetical protein
MSATGNFHNSYFTARFFVRTLAHATTKLNVKIDVLRDRLCPALVFQRGIAPQYDGMTR